MKQVVNPFLTSGYKGAEYFCDRIEETKKLEMELMGGTNVTLISPRRLGKSALIHHVFEKIRNEEPESHCFYIDILATKNLEQMVQLMAREIVGKLDKPSEKVLKSIAEFFKAFRPKVSIDTFTGAPEISFDLSPVQARNSLSSILDYIDRSGKRCYIAIDEFQQILNYSDTGTEALIRSKVQFMRNANFVFAGSQMHLMSDMFLSPRHPFYHSTDIESLKEIDEDKYLEFANKFFNKQGRSISNDDFDYIYKLVDGQTWYIQKVLSNIYFLDNEPITRELVMRAVSDAVVEQEPTFQYIYQSLSENQAALLQAIALERHVEKPYSSEFIRKYHLPAQSSVKRSLESLEKAQLIYHDLKDNTYIVYDRFLAMWFRRQFQ